MASRIINQVLAITAVLCLVVLLRSCDVVWGSVAATHTRYTDSNSVTDVNLDGNLDNLRNVVNGDLDNTNAAVSRGYRFIEILSTLPVAGTIGRIVFLTSDKILYFDNGTIFVPFVTVSTTGQTNGDIIFWNGTSWQASSGTHAQGDILYWTGTNWAPLAKSAVATNYLTNTGTDNNPAWGKVNLANGVTGILPVANLASRITIYRASDTFAAPSGVNQVYLTMVGGGGGGCGGTNGPDSGGGGGGGGGMSINYQFAVTPLSNYTVTIGAGGAGVTNGNAANDGGATSFDTVSIVGGQGADDGDATCDTDGGAGGGNSVGLGFDSTASITTAGSTAGSFVLRGGNGGAGEAAITTGGGGGGTLFGAGTAGGSGESATNATANTGAGGGGGGGGSSSGGNGGSGLVIVSY